MAMKVKVNTSGIRRLARNLEKISEIERVPLTDLLSPAFLQSKTRFANLREFLTEAGVEVEGLTYERLDADEVTEFVSQNTPYPNFRQMVKAAGAYYLKAQLLA
jgi:hypothetical protein